MITANVYEPHTHKDPSFPIIFHLDNLKKDNDFLSHWHENIEILYVVSGTIRVLVDATSITASQGEIIVINANNVHFIQSLTEESFYYCLIVDNRFCQEFGLDTGEIVFQRLIWDPALVEKYLLIIEEFKWQKSMYKAKIKAVIMELLICLYRSYTLSESPFLKEVEPSKIEIIKKAIRYMQNNYNKNISISDISDEVGVSKYYFCRIFKDITGYTTVRFLNLLRCSSARKLLQSGKYSVEEAAHICGFDNLSYFTKTYKMHMGSLPSAAKIKSNN